MHGHFGPQKIQIGSDGPETWNVRSQGPASAQKILIWPCDFFCACCEVQKPTLSRQSNFLLVTTPGSKARAHRPVYLRSCCAFCVIFGIHLVENIVRSDTRFQRNQIIGLASMAVGARGTVGIVPRAAGEGIGLHWGRSWRTQCSVLARSRTTFGCANHSAAYS